MSLRRLRATNEGWLTSYADLITNLLIFFVLLIAASHIQTGKMEKIVSSLASGDASPTSLSKAAKEVSKALAEQHITKDVSVRMTDEGLEISFNSGVTFASGQASVLPAMEAPLTKVLAAIKPYAAKYHLAVEGHTDEVPVTRGAYKSNWELSSARAMQIRERLEASGIDPKRMRVEAYADTKPLVIDGAANLDRQTYLAKQRRVVIRLY